MAVDPRFFSIVDGIRVVDLAAQLGASISGGDTNQVITGVASLAAAGKGEVAYQSAGPLLNCGPEAGAIIIKQPILRPNFPKLPRLSLSKRS